MKEVTVDRRRVTRFLQRAGAVTAATAAGIGLLVATASPAFAGEGVDYLQDSPECIGITHPGATGPCVVALQQALSEAGYPTQVDGIFGPATEANVRLLQTQNQLYHGTVVTGILTEQTIYILGYLSATEEAKRNVLQHEDGHADKLCDFLGPVGPTCDELMSPEPVY